MRIVLIGAVKFSLAALEYLLRLKFDVVGVVTRQRDGMHSDFADLASVAQAASVPCLTTRDINGENAFQWIRERRPDVLLCLGWSQLIRRPILDMAPLGIIGFHPALLPRNRGRHPLIWALALGLQESGSTFFLMDEGADSGEILSQRRVPIYSDDYAADLYARVTHIALEQLGEFLPKLAEGRLARQPQHGESNVWRKRSVIDGRIDWRMPAKGIYNLVRALSDPYPGAQASLDGAWFGIHRTEVVQAEASLFAEPGRVISVHGKVIVVRTGDGLLRILEHEFPRIIREGECW